MTRTRWRPPRQVDPLVSVVDATLGILLTLVSIVARFSYFYEYPIALWRLSATLNGDGYVSAINRLLKCEDRLLDAGYSLPLKRKALASRDPFSFMMSTEVQEELRQICVSASSTSLDVERILAQTKGWLGNWSCVGGGERGW